MTTPPMSGDTRGEWRTDVLPFEHRPSRQFVLIEGFRSHSGQLWQRMWADVAFIRRDDQPDSMFGYRREDMERMMRDGDIECIERVVGWLPASFPYFNALATPTSNIKDNPDD